MGGFDQVSKVQRTFYLQFDCCRCTFTLIFITTRSSCYIHLKRLCKRVKRPISDLISFHQYFAVDALCNHTYMNTILEMNFNKAGSEQEYFVTILAVNIDEIHMDRCMKKYWINLNLLIVGVRRTGSKVSQQMMYDMRIEYVWKLKNIFIQFGFCHWILPIIEIPDWINTGGMEDWPDTL